LQKPCDFDQLLEVLKNAYKKKVMNKNQIEERRMNEILKISQTTSTRDILRRLREIDAGEKTV